MTEIVTNIIMLIFLAGAVVTDVRARIIPNVLVAAGTFSGVLLSGLLPQGIGFLGSLAGIGVGLGCFLPIYILRAMGAGDVKLMAMTGAFLGPLATLEAVLWVLLAGGMLALIFAMRHGVARRLLGNVVTLFYSAAASVQTRNLPDFSETPSTGKLPYAVAIASGVAIFLLARAGGFNLL